MPVEIYNVPEVKQRSPLAVVLGLLMTGALFILIPLTQMVGEMRKPEVTELTRSYAVPPPPPVIEMEPPPPEEAPPETPLEVQEPPPQISLEQMDIALNPGTGGSVTGDFGLPSIDTTAETLGTTDLFDLTEVDQQPRPVSRQPPVYPASLRNQGIEGRVVVLFVLGVDGRVESAEIESSTHPGFNDAARRAIMNWRFEPGRKNGEPVRIRIRVPIPFVISR